MKKVLIILVLCIFSYSCAYTSISTIRNPYLPNKAFGRILIIAPFSDLQYQKYFEELFAYRLYLNKVDAFTGLDLIPPLRTYTEQELADILLSYEIDGILVVSLKDFYTSDTYYPQRSRTTGSAYLVGNYLRFNATTRISGGYTIKEPRLKFEIRLFDRESGEVAWLSSSLTSGDENAEISTLAKSLSRATIKALIKDKMLLESLTRK